MPKIGIMRYNRDNDFLFVAQDGDDFLQNVSVFCNSDSWGISKKIYPQANIIKEDRILRNDDSTIIFTGSDMIRTYEISKEDYDRIFDHNDDLGSLLKYAKEQLENGKERLMGLYFVERKEPATRDQIEKEYECCCNSLKDSRLDPVNLEYDRALFFAKCNGFESLTVNGKPRVNGILEINF